ncbi:MAG: CBS domain-containing protein [Rhodobacteraceae bacterium]|nr:MAG: CBS domain-containing protein [Paracoccaceae bacterium]
MNIKSVGEFLAEREVYVISSRASVVSACALMRDRDIGALPVLFGARLVGILSERDIIRRVVAEGRRTDGMVVAQVMTPDPRTVSPRASLADALMVMLEGGFRHLPVVDGGKLVAMLSIRDIPTEYRQRTRRYLACALPAAE